MTAIIVTSDIERRNRHRSSFGLPHVSRIFAWAAPAAIVFSVRG